MQTAYASLPDIVIANGQQNSQVLNGVHVYHDAVAIILYGTGAYGAETYTIEGNQDQMATNASSGWVALKNSAGTTLSTPPANESRQYGLELISAGSIRIRASGAVGAERRWKANKIWAWGAHV